MYEVYVTAVCSVQSRHWRSLQGQSRDYSINEVKRKTKKAKEVAND